MEKSSYRQFNPTYEDHKSKCMQFLNQTKYMNNLQQIANGQSKRIDILVEDLQGFFGLNEQEEEFVVQILTNTKRYQKLFSEAADALMPHRTDIHQNEDHQENLDEVILNQRINNLQMSEQQQNDPNNQLPNQLKRKFDLFIIRGPDSKPNFKKLRELNSLLIGHLINVKGIVVRCTDVKPMVAVAAYVCDACGFEVYQEVHTKQYTPLVDCQTKICKDNKTRGKLIANIPYSKFVAYQETKIQETPEQCPDGQVPRMFTVVAKAGNTRQCSPGDIVQIQGVLLPSQYDNYRGLKTLVHETHIEAFQIIREKKKYIENNISSELRSKIEYVRETTSFEDLYTALAKSIAPEIYGHEDVKKALILLMVGGSTMEMHDGMKIRGDINIALIGDPGVAKSQLLKHIQTISPRGIYTTGKGSSGVGLTAAVCKDPISNEITLEGGALVLADMGVCCIDEFDKMDEVDRTSIHEVMEQQTVSIAKAGITTTLNARTSILAAANPVYGRYNKKLTPHQNINLPAALLSRFDLVFLLLDKADRNQDELLARHVGHVHQKLKSPQLDFEFFDSGFLRAFVGLSKQFNPTIDKQGQTFIQQKYCEKRKEYAEGKQGYVYTTPRTLLGIIRLSQAIARLRFSSLVIQSDIEEALRLMECSQASVMENFDEEDKHKQRIDKLGMIFNTIVDNCKNREKSCDYIQIKNIIMKKGFLITELDKTLEEYSSLNVLMINQNKIILIQ